MKRYILSSNVNSRKSEYDAYLSNHIKGVIRSWEEILRPKLSDYTFADIDIDVASELVTIHDASKYWECEYDAYLNYFYPADGGERDLDSHDDKLVEAEFDKAWLHHQNENGHHWQYWVLIRDEGKTVALDMPIEYICEMLCDWHSFSLKNPDSTAYAWWQDNKDKMILSDRTIEIIESMIDFMKDPLTQDI